MPKTSKKDKGNWPEVGRRISKARTKEGLSQQQLGDHLGLDRSAVSRIEAGERMVDSLELARIAAALTRPIELFVLPQPQSVISRRAALEVSGETRTDLILERIVSDVELLIELKLFKPAKPRRRGVKSLRSLKDAEAAAYAALAALPQISGPIRHLIPAAEKLGLYAFALDLPQPSFDGSYVALEAGGVALVRGQTEIGRRRFTLAHEIGHHFLEDEYDTYSEVPIGKSTRERLINAFAIHFLMPRKSVTDRWNRLMKKGEEHRGAAIHLGHEYGVSWSALCSHLRNLGLVSEVKRKTLAADLPRKVDFLERGLHIHEDMSPPSLPPGYMKAVLKAYRTHKISAERAVEMLHGEIDHDQLPEVDRIPLDALRPDMELLG